MKPVEDMTEAELDAELRANGIDPIELQQKMLARLVKERDENGADTPMLHEAIRQFSARPLIERLEVSRRRRPTMAHEKGTEIPEHTPPPWQASPYGDCQWVVTVESQDFHVIVVTSQGNDEANAKFIVTACNAHAALTLDNERLRKALIQIGRDCGCALADEVSTDFLMHIPEELRLQRKGAPHE